MGEGTGGVLSEREKALGDAFFQGSAEEIRERLALHDAETAARDALRDATGIENPDVLAELAGLGIRVDTLSALTLIPLIDVAWADGEMDAKECDAILQAAVATGVQPDSMSYRLLEIWMQEQPPPDLTNVWRSFIQALCETLSDGESGRLSENLLRRARDVAAAAGNHLDRTPHIAPEEEACLTALAAAFPQKS